MSAKDPFAVLHGSDESNPTLRLAGGDGQADLSDDLPPLDDEEFNHLLAEAEAASPEEYPDIPPPTDAAEDGPIRPRILSVRELVARHPNLRPPVVHGILREGEIINIIAPPKRGKSWLAMDLGLSVASGRMWLQTFQTEPGGVLSLDNELHAESSAFRIPKVAEARGIMKDEYADRFHIDNLRGRLQDIKAMAGYFAAIPKGRYKLIILDAMYRFLPQGVEENDNAGITQIYNCIDRYAAQLGCSFVLIHHASKGNQSGKSITDVGSGAGSMSRASDSHMILRDHEEPNAVVLEGVVRSFEPLKPLCISWEFPVWKVAANLDPAKLKDNKRKSEAEAKANWTAEQFVALFVAERPKTKEAIIGPAQRGTTDALGLSKRKAEELLAEAEDKGIVYRWTQGGANKKQMYATVPQPMEEPSPATADPARSRRKATIPG